MNHSPRLNLRTGSIFSQALLFLPDWTPGALKLALIATFVGSAALTGYQIPESIVSTDFSGQAERPRPSKNWGEVYGPELAAGSGLVAEASMVAAPPAPEPGVTTSVAAPTAEIETPAELTGFEAVSIPSGVEVRFLVADLFEPGSAELTEAGRQRLRELGKTLIEAGYAERELQVLSHTDDLPVVRLRKIHRTNWELSGARSFAAVRVFEELGFPAAKLLGTGYGPGRPLARGADEASRKLNRRLIIRLTRS